jgi:Zn ribbon nucleic-acid-binding protein
VFRTFNQVGLAVDSATGGEQEPWVSNSPIEGEFYFAGPSGGAPAGSLPVMPLPAAPLRPADPSAPPATRPINPLPILPLPKFSADTCKFGFVWREASANDHVCVAPGTRAQARDDNAHAGERVNRNNHDYGPDTCTYGYVWRETTPLDHVCVTPGTRAQAADDNAHNRERVYGR